MKKNLAEARFLLSLKGSNQTGNDEAGDYTGTDILNRIKNRHVLCFHPGNLLRRLIRYARLLHFQIQPVCTYQPD